MVRKKGDLFEGNIQGTKTSGSLVKHTAPKQKEQINTKKTKTVSLNDYRTHEIRAKALTTDKYLGWIDPAVCSTH